MRPARGDERRRWDALAAAHDLSEQFMEPGLRHIAVWRGRWMALVGWQPGALDCAPRDRWLGWHRAVQCLRVHLIVNNKLFVILPEAAGTMNLASRTLGLSLRRLSADWQAAHGHPLELAETFVDLGRFGTSYMASNWTRVGRAAGHSTPKEIFVRPLRAGAVARLADPADRTEWSCRATPVRYAGAELRSLRDLFAAMPDSRRGQACKQGLVTVLSICALARLAGLRGPTATRQFAHGLDQRELRALGAWRDADGRFRPPSDATICCVLADTDPDALADVLRQWTAPRRRWP